MTEIPITIISKTYALSVDFKMKPPRKSDFLCYGENQRKLCNKSCTLLKHLYSLTCL